MEAQICKLLMEFCYRKLRDVWVAECVQPTASGIKWIPDGEPWLKAEYANPYHTTLRDVVLLLRRLYSFW